MNDLIQEFSEQADLFADSKLHMKGEYHPDWHDIRDKKFAELIILECARIARATPAPDFEEHLKQQLGHTWDMAALEAGREITKHFGIE